MAAAEGEVIQTENIAVEEAVEETPPKAVIIAKKPIESESNKKKQKKNIWNESDKWGHDLFRPDEQTPKSKDELVNTYGYDIRNEDNPPKARRKRRYARGAVKYTRQWQDENAYGRGRSPVERTERKERKEHSDRTDRNERTAQIDRIPKERSGSDRSIEHKHRDERKDFDKRETYERRDSYDRKERSDRRDKHRINDRNERTLRSEKSNEFSHKKERFRNDRPLNENRKFDFEESSEKRDKPFSKDDFPELPNNDLRKKLNSNQSGAQPEVWKSRFSGESDDQIKNDYKTEPMKIIEAIEHNNRAVAHNESNPPNVVRTLTFENSKYSQRRSSGNYDYEEERAGTGRTRNRKNAEVVEASGRPIRKSNNNMSYQNYSQEKKETNDNYRNNRNNVRTERTEESNRNVERYYEDDYRNQRDRESNYIIETNIGLQKLSIEDKSQVLNRTNDSEQTRPKRYSSLRQQQQRVIPENMANIASNTQMSQTNENLNLSAHQFYDSHTIQTTAYFTETSSPRTTYHPYMSPSATDAGPQSHPPSYIQQPLPQTIQQRYIPQPNAPTGAGDATRYISTAVPPNVVTAPVPTPQMAQPMSQTMPQTMPQTGAVPPPPQTVISAPPPGTTFIPSFPSGYPQFPPAPPPPTHVPPGYTGHVTAQQPSPLQLAELYRGGVTYYDTQSQQQNTVRQIPQRRPKAAIPIVPPPDPHPSEGDGDKTYVSVNS